MTESDKDDMSNILADIREMKERAADSSMPYVDQRVLSYALSAKKDYLDSKNYILGLIRDNLGLFFNLDRMKVSVSGCCYAGYDAAKGEKFSLDIGMGVYVTIRLTDFYTLKRDSSYYEFHVNDLEVYDVKVYTSDTRDDSYNVCSSWDLVETGPSKDKFIVFEAPKSPQEWNEMYGLATWTRAKTKLLVRQFKEALRNIKNSYHSTIENNYSIKRNLDSNVKIYTKIGL